MYRNRVRTYIAYFYNYKFFTSKYVYGPKYETENIILLFKKLIEKYNKNRVIIYDLCSGSGCLGITIKKLYKNNIVKLVDNNIYAIYCMIKNIIEHNIDVSIEYENIFNISNHCDIIVSNPPYIAKNLIKSGCNKYIHNSLNGGENSIDFIIKMFTYFNNVYFIILELGSDQQLLEINKIKHNFSCIFYYKPYNNAKICFCIFQNINYPLLDLNQHD